VCGFCNVWLCMCVCGFSNVLVGVYVGFIMCVCVSVGFLMCVCGCVYVWLW